MGLPQRFSLSSTSSLGFRMSWVTDTAPWRMAVATQSALVSPAPTTTTRLPAAVRRSSLGCPSRARVASFK